MTLARDRALVGMLILGLLGARARAGDPPKPTPVVTPAAEVEIQTFVVQDKASRAIATDKAKLAVGKRGGVRKTVTLTPGKKSKATGKVDVDVRVLVTPVSSTPLGVELDVESLATAAGGKAPTQSRMHITLEEGATKLINVYEHEPFGARIMAMIKATDSEPIVTVEGAGKTKGLASAPATKDLRSVSFQIDIKRLDNGEQVYEEQPSLVTWVGKAAEYKIAYQIPLEVIPGENGRSDVRYGTENAEISIMPGSLKYPELRLDVHIRSVVYQGTDRATGFTIDRVVPIIVKAGEGFELYAIYGQDDVEHLDAAKRAKASGYVFHVTPRF